MLSAPYTFDATVHLPMHEGMMMFPCWLNFFSVFKAVLQTVKVTLSIENYNQRIQLYSSDEHY
jgi:hypothetical protein